MEEDLQVLFASYQLQGDALQWWKTMEVNMAKEVGTIQESFPRLTLYGYSDGGIEDGVYKFGSRKHDGGAI